MAMIFVVEEGWEVVIYRLGRFNRIAGPGPVQILPRLEKIHRRFDVREEQFERVIKSVLAYGIPVDVALHFRIKLDIRGCVAAQARQAEICSWDRARLRQVLVDTVQHAAHSTLRRYELEHPLAANAGFFDKLAPLLPGAPEYNHVMGLLRGQLAHELGSLGYRLPPDSLFWFCIAKLPQSLIDAFDKARFSQVDYERRKRIWQDMQSYMAGLPPHLQAHMMAVVEQLEPPPVNIPAAGASAQTKVKTDAEGMARVESEMVMPQPAAPPPSSPEQEHAPAPAPSPAPYRLLSDDDVAQVQAPPPAPRLRKAG